MYSKTAERSSALVAHAFGAWCSSSSLVSVAKNVSATALSKHEPTAPIDWAMPASWQVWPNVRTDELPAVVAPAGTAPDRQASSSASISILTAAFAASSQ